MSNSVRRYRVESVLAPLEEDGNEREFPEEHLILLLGEAPALSAGLYAALAASNYRVRQIVPGKQTRALGQDRFEVDFSSLDSVKALRGLLAAPEEVVGAVLNLMEFEVAQELGEDPIHNAKCLFLLLKVLENDLKASAGVGGGWLLNFTALDGHFGLRRQRDFPMGVGGTLGVAKTVAREWAGIRVKCIDVDKETDPHVLVAQIWEEIGTANPELEVGFTHEGRWRLHLNDDRPAGRAADLKLDADGVLLVTGGGYGITAEITLALAERYRPQLVLVGRSALPKDEPEFMRELRQPQQLRQFFIQESKARDAKIVPAEIERKLKQIFKDRQIRANLEALRNAGARVEYHALDLRDAEAFGSLLDHVYAKWGRIDGVLHGAGVIEDKLIRDKSLESFRMVFDTKVIPATVLAKKLRPESLKFLVFFSSIAGRFGNVGQCDYSAANEVLNKFADLLGHRWPHARVVSINWGPWDSGMVNDELRKLYEANGIGVIPVEVGKQFCVDELQDGNNQPEVVIGANITEISERGLGSPRR